MVRDMVQKLMQKTETLQRVPGLFFQCHWHFQLFPIHVIQWLTSAGAFWQTFSTCPAYPVNFGNSQHCKGFECEVKISNNDTRRKCRFFSGKCYVKHMKAAIWLGKKANEMSQKAVAKLTFSFLAFKLAALHKKVPYCLSRCHTKRRMGARGRARTSFCMTPTF